MSAEKNVGVKPDQITLAVDVCLEPAANLLAGEEFKESSQFFVCKQIEVSNVPGAERVFLEFSARKVIEEKDTRIFYSVSESTVLDPTLFQNAKFSINNVEIESKIIDNANCNDDGQDLTGADIRDLINTDDNSLLQGEVIIAYRIWEYDKEGLVYRAYDFFRFVDGNLMGTFATNDSAFSNLDYRKDKHFEGLEIEDYFNLSWDQDDIEKIVKIVYILDLVDSANSDH